MDIGKEVDLSEVHGEHDVPEEIVTIADKISSCEEMVEVESQYVIIIFL